MATTHAVDQNIKNGDLVVGMAASGGQGFGGRVYEVNVYRGYVRGTSHHPLCCLAMVRHCAQSPFIALPVGVGSGTALCAFPATTPTPTRCGRGGAEIKPTEPRVPLTRVVFVASGSHVSTSRRGAPQPRRLRRARDPRRGQQDVQRLNSPRVPARWGAHGQRRAKVRSPLLIAHILHLPASRDTPTDSVGHTHRVSSTSSLYWPLREAALTAVGRKPRHGGVSAFASATRCFVLSPLPKMHSSNDYCGAGPRLPSRGNIAVIKSLACPRGCVFFVVFLCLFAPGTQAAT